MASVRRGLPSSCVSLVVSLFSLGSAEEVAEAAFFIASEASYIVAETLRVARGWSAMGCFDAAHGGT